MIYRCLIRPVLRLFPSEMSMNVSLRLLRFFHKCRLGILVRISHKKRSPLLKRNVFGINFANPIGLGAGIDRNGECCNVFSDMGFGFVEIGSLTHHEQSGRPRPRIFRLKECGAMAQRTGYPNKGVKSAINALRKDPPRCPVAANIVCRQGNMSEAELVEDYRDAFALMYDFADFFVINTVMPPFDGVDLLEDVDVLSEVMDTILDMRLCYDTYKPVLLKVSADISRESLSEILDYARLSGIDGIVAAGGTTASPEDLSASAAKRVDKIGQAIYSGAPVKKRTLELVRFINSYTGGTLPIIASGGIMKPQDAADMLDAGASLVELCSGLLYNGPKLVKNTVKHLESIQGK